MEASTSLTQSQSISQTDSSDKEINVYLKIMKTVALKVKESKTIENLKAILGQKEGISEEIQDIFFSGDRLRDDQRLIDCGIQNNSTLHLILQNLTRMKLHVKTPLSQKTIVVDALVYHTVQNIKSLIQVKEGIRSDEFTLVYDGKVLKEDMTLASLNMKSESTLYLLFCPKNVQSISVKAPTGVVVELKVQVLFTVGDVKAIVGSMIGVPVNDQIMIYAGNKLKDCKTLAFYDIKEGCLLEMYPTSIQIFIRTPTQEIWQLKVEPLFTVCDVKTLVGGMIDVSVSNHNIFYAGRKLEDHKTLACYDIEDQSILEVLSPSFQIFVKAWNGKTVALDVQQYNTINDLKGKLFYKLQIPYHLHSIIVFAGKRLEADRDLASYNIQRNSTLRMVLGAPPSKLVKLKLTTINPPVSGSTTISDLKKLAQVNFQEPIKELLLHHVLLQDEHSLADYCIALDEIVTLSLKRNTTAVSMWFVTIIWNKA